MITQNNDTKDTHSATVSFVHGYENLDLNIPGKERPALWHIENGDSNVYKYFFPRNPSDFIEVDSIFSGTLPLKSAKDFKKLPRFGFTGLQKIENRIYAGSWNAVYEINAENFELKRIISNQLMSDLHGIHADSQGIITILTSQDTIVFSDFDGNIIDHFSVDRSLNVYKENNLIETDWRFVSKQFRGSCGYWHFNYVQRFGNEIWLTSRSACCFVVIDIPTHKAHLRLMNLCTPALLHDGLKYKEKYYFTSIDGKILIVEDGNLTDKRQRENENADNIGLYHRDLIANVIRLSETSLGREPNWCRGIACKDNIIYVSIDGRYDTDLSFGLIALKEDSGEILFNYRLKWSEIGNEEDIRYVTGFDVI